MMSPHPKRVAPVRLRDILSCLRTATSTILACGFAALAVPAHAAGSLIDVQIIDRQDGRELPVYTRRGVHWIEGTPGHEYAIRLRNRSGGRVLAVTSVDGVNVVTGETATPSQSGYVLDPYGWDPLESTCRHASLSIL